MPYLWCYFIHRLHHIYYHSFLWLIWALPSCFKSWKVTCTWYFFSEFGILIPRAGFILGLGHRSMTNQNQKWPIVSNWSQSVTYSFFFHAVTKRRIDLLFFKMTDNFLLPVSQWPMKTKSQSEHWWCDNYITLVFTSLLTCIA